MSAPEVAHGEKLSPDVLQVDVLSPDVLHRVELSPRYGMAGSCLLTCSNRVRMS